MARRKTKITLMVSAYTKKAIDSLLELEEDVKRKEFDAEMSEKEIKLFVKSSFEVIENKR